MLLRNFIFIFIFLLSTQVSAINLEPNQLVVGATDMPGPNGWTIRQGFLLQKKSGKAWNHSKNIPLLPNSELSKINCKNGVCITAGFHSRPGGDSDFWLLTSHDGGDTWSWIKEIKNLKLNISMVKIIAADCTNQICNVIVQMFFPSSPNNNLAIFNSRDNGKSWSMIENISDLPLKLGPFDGNLLCRDKVCMLVGNHYESVNDEQEHSTHDFPLIVVSKDNGYRWQFIKEFPITPPTTDLDDFTLHDLVYAGNHTWMTLGKKWTFKQHPHNESYIFVSHNDGQSWEITKHMQSDSVSDFEAIACQKGICIVTGDNWANKDKNSNFILISRDLGKTWETYDNINIDANDYFTHLVCNENSCIASTREEGKLFLSQDHGEHWQKIVMPSELNNVYFSKIKSKDNVYLAAGTYKDLSNKIRNFLFQSVDNGNTWTLFNNFDDLPIYNTMFDDIEMF